MVSRTNIRINKQSNVISANYSGKPLKAENQSHNIKEVQSSYLQSQKSLEKTKVPSLVGKAYRDEFIKSQNLGNIIKVNFNDKDQVKPRIADSPPPFEPWGVGVGLDITA